MDELEERSGPALDRIVGATGGVAIATLLGLALGPTGLVVASLGAASSPVVEELSYFARTALQRRFDRAERAVHVATDSSGLSVEQLLQAALSDDKKLELASRALTAAALSSTNARIDALARAFASGVLAQDVARVDEQAILIDALAGLEPAHVRLMSVLSRPATHADYDPSVRDELQYSWGRDDIVAADAGLERPLDALISRVVGNGLVFDHGAGRLNYRPLWKLTEFGRLCLAELQQRGNP
jgi:hypothetical protein